MKIIIDVKDRIDFVKATNLAAYFLSSLREDGTFKKLRTCCRYISFPNDKIGIDLIPLCKNDSDRICKIKFVVTKEKDSEND